MCSEKLYASDQEQAIVVDVTGVQQLGLLVYGSRDFYSSWSGARLRPATFYEQTEAPFEGGTPGGEIVGEVNPDPALDSMRYAGEYYDAETGLIYLRNRYYDPSIGRFITEDPARDGLNWYAYCGNNPVMFVDPWGLKDVPLRSTVESLGGTVTWDSTSSSATVSFGSAGSMVYKKQPYKINFQDTSSSLVPYLKLDNDLVYRMYIDDKMLYRDFGIQDFATTETDLFNSDIIFMLFKRDNKYYQRFSIGTQENVYEKVSYKDFNYTFYIGNNSRYDITCSNIPAIEVGKLNGATQNYIRDMIAVFGSDPTFANFPFGGVIGIIDGMLGDIGYAPIIASENDYKVQFGSRVYYLKQDTFELIK